MGKAFKPAGTKPSSESKYQKFKKNRPLGEDKQITLDLFMKFVKLTRRRS